MEIIFVVVVSFIAIFMPFAIVLCIIFSFIGKKKGLPSDSNSIIPLNKTASYESGKMIAGTLGLVRGQRAPWLDEFKSKDPDFDDSAFIVRVQSVISHVQEAIAKRDVKLVRPFESNSMFNVHRIQIEQLLAQGYLEHFYTPGYEGIDVVGAETKNGYERIKTEARVTMAHYTTDAKGKIFEGNKVPLDVTLELVFKRKAGVTTNISHTDIMSCPKCGGPLNALATDICPYCKTGVCNGDYDWVLDSYIIGEYEEHEHSTSHKEDGHKKESKFSRTVKVFGICIVAVLLIIARTESRNHRNTYSDYLTSDTPYEEPSSTVQEFQLGDFRISGTCSGDPTAKDYISIGAGKNSPYLASYTYSQYTSNDGVEHGVNVYIQKNNYALEEDLSNLKEFLLQNIDAGDVDVIIKQFKDNNVKITSMQSGRYNISLYGDEKDAYSLYVSYEDKF